MRRSVSTQVSGSSPSPTSVLGALGEVEELDAGGHPLLGPAQGLGGAVLGQAAVEHRLDRTGLLVGVQLLARNVLDRAVGVLGLGIAHDVGHVGEAELARRCDAVKAGDELEVVAVGTQDDGDEQALQRDRAGERVDVRGVEVADVVGHADAVERNGRRVVEGGHGHVVLLGHGWPAPVAGRSPPERTPAGRATIGGVGSPPGPRRATPRRRARSRHPSGWRPAARRAPPGACAGGRGGCRACGRSRRLARPPA